MRVLLLTSILTMAASVVIAQESPYAESMSRSIAAMKAIVAPGSAKREFLYCAIISTHLDLDDMYGLFIRKAGDGVTDEVAFAMSVSYMMGFFESELLNMKGSDQTNARDQKDVLTLVYRTICLPHALPK